MRASPCRLLAIDLDGTLLRATGEISPRNRDALHRAHQAGMKIVVCTGRCFAETRPVLQDIGLDLDAVVTVSGAVVSDAASGRTLARSVLCSDLGVELVHWLRERGYAVLWVHDADQAGFDGFLLDGPHLHEALERWLHTSPCRVDRVRELPQVAFDPVRVTVLDEPGLLEPVAGELGRRFGPRVSYNYLGIRNYTVGLLEVFAAGVTKWRGIAELCRRWEIDPAATVAIGDDMNDLDMIRCAGLGVAVANARPAIVAAARRVVSHHEADGVGELIDDLLREGIRL
jgi:hypothetical protein